LLSFLRKVGAARDVAPHDGMTLPRGAHNGVTNCVLARDEARWTVAAGTDTDNAGDVDVGGDALDGFDGFRFHRLRRVAAAAAAQQAAQHTPAAAAPAQLCAHTNNSGVDGGSCGGPAFAYTSTAADSLHFGHGAHACAGRFFAAAAIKLVLAHVLERYDVRLAAGAARPRNVETNLSVMPDPRKVIMLRRRK
jgi:hypothetical protein